MWRCVLRLLWGLAARGQPHIGGSWCQPHGRGPRPPVLTGNVALLLWLLRAVPGNGPIADAFFIYKHNTCFHIEIL